jgi:hypothetical protein
MTNKNKMRIIIMRDGNKNRYEIKWESLLKGKELTNSVFCIIFAINLISNHFVQVALVLRLWNDLI